MTEYDEASKRRAALEKRVEEDIRKYHRDNMQYSKWQVVSYISELYEFYMLDLYTTIDTINRIFKEDYKNVTE